MAPPDRPTRRPARSAPSWIAAVLWPTTLSFTDDAGVSHDADPRDWKHSSSWTDPRRRQTLRRAARMIRPYGTKYFLTYMTVIFLGTIPIVVYLPNHGPLRLLLQISLYVLATVLSAIITRSHARLQTTRAEHLLKRRSICPTCAYDLRGIPACPKAGLTICPECGAAWRTGEPPSPLP